MPMWQSAILAMVLVANTAIAGTVSPTGGVSLRIYDYANIDSAQLQEAMRHVDETYRAAGVELEWRSPVRPRELESQQAKWPQDGRATVSVVILASEKSVRYRGRTDVAGYAPVTAQRGGRVAYVIGDRITRIAGLGHVNESNVLAGVIAHELAHLLMPARRHSPTGLMRASWRPDDFRWISRQRFSPEEARAIRRTVIALGGGALRAAD